MKKTTLIATTLVTVLTASSAFAWWGDNGRGDGRHCSEGNRSGQFMKGEHDKRGMMGNNVKEHMNREFSATEIRTLNEARLIMQGNPNVKVGKVTPTKDGFNVTIVTKDNSLVKEMGLAKNGMPLERYNMVRDRIAAKEQQ
ncbi:hypothetical protein [Endozoicomonas sp. SCSIO W0465]|uniref:hypothetical protein n=1 Tax=Endozoicomonas sp. SCSIO W0465 TaxID=2918516 RepID=UPI0020751D65|nr:hypothetical protein [Endozoicomonas sp. SCSIO W0465]USE37106.1 hypothetical protein MJO57_02425 [Endozoicomonas sp. SCSIO W0465]